MAAHHSSQKPARPGWNLFAGKFDDPRECLAAFVALETAEVLRGVKPANLLNITNRRGVCGRNLYQLWRQYGSEVVGTGGLEALELVDRHDSLLVLFYDPVALAVLLARKGVAAILTKAGYGKPADTAASLAELQCRLQAGGFPHEIGVFLGYPLKDVVGFMGWARLPFTCQGPWKIYGDPASSLELANSCRECRLSMARRLARSTDPLLCLRGGGRTHRLKAHGKRHPHP